MSDRHQLFSWELSYFSGKVRSYLRYKDHFGALGPGFEDILASYELILGLLVPNTGSVTVPQIRTSDGTWIHDSSEIIDYFETVYPSCPVVPDPNERPQQCVASYLLELLADEWMVVWGFWERWHHCLDGVEPNQLAFNQLQWGSAFAPNLTGAGRSDAARAMFDGPFGVAAAPAELLGPYAGLQELGMTGRTQDAWTESTRRILAILDRHFDEHDFVFGGRPSLADFALMGPLYPHLYRDPVPGFEMRIHHPLVAQWVERTNGTNALDARSYNQKLYSLVDGELVGRPATSHDGEWTQEDVIPSSLAPLLGVFFEEMWPVLESSVERLSSFLSSPAHTRGGELPSLTFRASPGFEEHQQGDGALTHEFEIGGVRERRMVVPYQVWMLQRLARVVRPLRETASGRQALESLLTPYPGGMRLLELDSLLAACPLRKEGGRLFSVET
jgi:glutathione S-transferase